VKVFKFIVRMMILRVVDFILRFVLGARKLFSPKVGDPFLPDSKVLETYKFLPGDLVTCAALVESMENDLLQLGDEAPLDVDGVLPMGSVVGYSYPNDDEVLVAYFNVVEFGSPVIKRHKREELVLMHSAIQTMIMNKAVMSALKESDFMSGLDSALDSEDSLVKVLKSDGEDDPDDGGNDDDGGVIVH
jgi:hypothetical protein